MVTKPNLTFMVGIDNPRVKFILRIPATFSIVNTLIAEAMARCNWTDIGMLSEEVKKESAFYRSYERNIEMQKISLEQQ